VRTEAVVCVPYTALLTGHPEADLAHLVRRIEDTVGALRERTREFLLAEVQRQMLKPAEASDSRAVLRFSAAFLAIL
jgi:hypothetical protein